jgi:hypothetical protein
MVVFKYQGGSFLYRNAQEEEGSDAILPGSALGIYLATFFFIHIYTHIYAIGVEWEQKKYNPWKERGNTSRRNEKDSNIHLHVPL